MSSRAVAPSLLAMVLFWCDCHSAATSELTEAIKDAGFDTEGAVLSWALESEHNGPFHVVNFLKFNESARYPADSSYQRTGLEAQARYGEPLGPLIRSLGIRSVLRSHVIGNALTLGTGTEWDWDAISVAYYASRDAFISMLTSETYKQAVVHKYAALERTRSILTAPDGAGQDNSRGDE